jgi:euchromatic histone-lysine N-methyltransferase
MNLIKQFNRFMKLFYIHTWLSWLFVDCAMGKNRYTLHKAVENGSLEAVKACLKSKKCDINELDQNHWTALHCAANARQLQICKLLLSKGADPSITTSNNATALHFVSRMKDHALLLQVLKALVDKGADVNHPNVHAETPLHEAALRGSLVCTQFLLDAGAKIDVQNT